MRKQKDKLPKNSKKSKRKKKKLLATKLKSKNTFSTKHNKLSPQSRTPPDDDRQAIRNQLQIQLQNAKTVFWSSLKPTQTNRLRNCFALPNLVKTFRVTVFAVSADGVYGTHTSLMTICQPFNLVVESPLFVRPGETAMCKMVLENNRDSDTTVELVTLNRTVEVPKRQVYNVEFEVAQDAMPMQVEVAEGGETLFHTVALPVYQGITYNKAKTLKFQVTDSDSAGAQTMLELPANLALGSLRLKVEYKQLSADVLVKGLDRLVREPCGCFEQTSATTFPLVMLLQYIDGLQKKSSKMLQIRLDAEAKMKRGIKRLLGYECSKGGFEWFGANPGHPTLSAYGVWQFLEINKLGPYIDVKVIDRTLDWLRKKYQTKTAQFEVDSSGYDSFARPPQFCSDIYILFILTLMDDYHVNYKSIVAHKIAQYEAHKSSAGSDSYLHSFIALVYLGESRRAAI